MEIRMSKFQLWLWKLRIIHFFTMRQYPKPPLNTTSVYIDLLVLKDEEGLHPANVNYFIESKLTVRRAVVFWVYKLRYKVYRRRFKSFMEWRTKWEAENRHKNQPK